MQSNTQQPNVHKVAQQNLDYVLHGTAPAMDTSHGGSVNEKWLVTVRNYFADKSNKANRQALIDALKAQEENGIFTFGGGCEQGIGSPHVELLLNVFSCLFLSAMRDKDAELIGYMRRLFIGLYALGMWTSLNKWTMLIPGARQSQNGPHSIEMDATLAVMDGRIKDYKHSGFRNLYPDTCAPWCLLEALKENVVLFDVVRSWNSDKDYLANLPKLKWPVTKTEYQDGFETEISVPNEDAALMGKIGSAGIGVSKVQVQRSTGRVAWLPFKSAQWTTSGPTLPVLGEKIEKV